MYTMSVLLRERDDDDVYHYIGRRLKLERETENGGVCAKKRVSTKAVVSMAKTAKTSAVSRAASVMK